MISFPIRISTILSSFGWFFYSLYSPFFLCTLMQPQAWLAICKWIDSGFSLSAKISTTVWAAFNSRRFICSLLSYCHQGPLADCPWHTASQPDFEASDWITICGGQWLVCTVSYSDVNSTSTNPVPFLPPCVTQLSSYDPLMDRPVICCWRLLYCRGAGRSAIAVEESLPVGFVPHWDFYIQE